MLRHPPEGQGTVLCLIREDNQTAGKTWVWTYNTVGNILSRKEYAYTLAENPGTTTDTVNYAYANTQWQDLLTNYDGSPITYDAIGNPLSDESRTYTWQNGRQLASLNQNGTQVTYTYDGSGLRTGKTVTSNGATQSYTYIYNGDKLEEMTANGGTLRFTYDTNGHPATVVYSNATYYYVTNLQGDVIAILDGSRNSVAEYTYNAWGQVMSVTGSMANTLGQQNPLRYRGYVYDTESGLYYLQSRYYDPKVGRFINADALASTGQGVLGYNMFSYCLNSPVNNADPSGEFALVDDVVFISTATIVVIALILIPPVPVLDTVLTGLTKVTADATEAFSYAANILTAKTKGKERVKDTGLAQESDAEISQKAHDKTLPKSEQRRYQTEEKARGLRNHRKRLDLYQ